MIINEIDLRNIVKSEIKKSMKETRVSSDRISSIQENEIFVFGSNLSGLHAGGAARLALNWGAKWGNPVGLQGKTYAIPTKSEGFERTFEISEIKPFVDKFIDFAKQNQNLTFLVTEIGCGLAGLTPGEVAPLFVDAVDVKNIFLPQSFWNVITNL
jgi:hypothetical protein